MLDFFKLARSTRDPSLATKSYVELMEEAAEEAGWHLVYVPNLQNRTKFQVRYERPFSSAVVAELACRMEPTIMGFLRKRDIDPSLIDSFVGFGFFNFIKTYKPEVHNTDEKVQAAIYRSVQNKVDQGQRKEIFRYRPTSSSGDPTKKHRYVNTPREVSLSRRAHYKDEEGDELGSFIADPLYDQPNFCSGFEEAEERGDLIKEYAKTPGQKIFLEILIEAGASGRITIRDLAREAKESPIIRDEARNDLIEAYKSKGKTEEELTEEMIDERVFRKAKAYFRGLREILAPRLNNSTIGEED